MVAAGSSNSKQKRPPHIDAIAGGFAGAVARFVVGPLDVLKIRFQVQIEPILQRQGAQTATLEVIGSKYTGLKQAFGTVLKEEGIAVSMRRDAVICALQACRRQASAGTLGKHSSELLLNCAYGT